MTKCPNCGAPMQENECSYCHYIEQESQNNISNNVVINHVYNQPNIKYTNDVSSKSKIVTLLLCVFFGYLGIHQFYVGKVGMGILYFFTMGLFGFGWIIDIILILCGSFKDSNNLPIK